MKRFNYFRNLFAGIFAVLLIYAVIILLVNNHEIKERASIITFSAITSYAIVLTRNEFKKR